MRDYAIITELRAGTDDERRRALLAELYDRNRATIRGACRPYVRAGYEIEDALQDAFIGLCKAVEHYDESAGLWAPYLGAWVRATVGRSFMNAGNLRRLPVYLQTRIRQLKQLENAAKIENRAPTDKELSRALGITPEQLDRTRRAMYESRPASLSQPIEGADGLTLGDTIPDTADPIAATVEAISADQDAARIWASVDSLTPEQADTIRHRYKDGQTLKETAQAQGVSLGAVKSRERAALARLKHKPELRRIWRDYGGIIYHGGLQMFKRCGSVVELAAINHMIKEGL